MLTVPRREAAVSQPGAALAKSRTRRPDLRLVGGRYAERVRDGLDRIALGGADVLAALPMRGRDLVGQMHDESFVVVDLLGCRDAVQHPDRVADLLEAAFPELLRSSVARAHQLRLRRHDLVQELALAVLLAGLRIRLRHRPRLAPGTTALRREHDQARARRSCKHGLPPLVAERGLRRHGVPSFFVSSGHTVQKANAAAARTI